MVCRMYALWRQSRIFLSFSFDPQDCSFCVLKKDIYNNDWPKTCSACKYFGQFSRWNAHALVLVWFFQSHLLTIRVVGHWGGCTTCVKVSMDMLHKILWKFISASIYFYTSSGVSFCVMQSFPSFNDMKKQ